MSLTSTVRATFLASLILACTSPAEGQVYDSGPLNAPIAIPSTPLPTDPAEFMAWLDSSATALNEDELTVVREHLFALISADAKHRFRNTGIAFPSAGDSALAELFSGADRLGVPGAELVAAALRSPERLEGMREATPGIAIAFDTLYALTAQDDGWMVRFPHYFMIGAASRQPTESGLETTTVVLSTLFARDAVDASQATILLLSAAAPAPDFAAEWLSRLGLNPTDTADVPIPSAIRAYRAMDAGSAMSRELVVLAPPGRTILAIFVGLSGTDDTNRPHFVNLLETLRVRSGTD